MILDCTLYEEKEVRISHWMNLQTTSKHFHSVCSINTCPLLPSLDLTVLIPAGVLVTVLGLCWAPFHLDRLMWSYMDTSSIDDL